MYTPRLGKQAGGATTETIPTSDISVSTLQYIMQVANITSLDALTTLSQSQISSLSAVIDERIAEDNAQIALTQLSIAQITAMINGPNGLQAQYDLADQQYISSLTAYNLRSTILENNKSRYARDVSTLRSLYSQSTFYISSINFYQEQYDRLLSSLQVNASLYSLYEKDYQASLQNLQANSALYSGALVNFSTISTLVQTDLAQIPVNQQMYANDLSTFNNISTQIVKYRISDTTFKESMLSSYNNISTLLGPSSFAMFEAGTLFSTIAYYQSMDTLTDSKIEAMQSDIDSLRYQISDLTASNTGILGSMAGEIASVTTTGGQFYTLYGQGLDAECDEYLFAVQELNSQLGYITASLGIARNANFVAIDQYTMTILSYPRDTVTPGIKSALVADNDIIYQVIQQINSLDAQFNHIIAEISAEKIARKTFISKRRNILINYEAQALGWTPQQIADNQADYFVAFSDLNITIDTINQNVSRRTTLLRAVQTILSNTLPGGTGQSIRDLINYYFQIYLGSNGANQLPDNLLYLTDDDGALLGGSVIVKEYNPPNTILSVMGIDYAFIPPIVF